MSLQFRTYSFEVRQGNKSRLTGQILGPTLSGWLCLKICLVPNCYLRALHPNLREVLAV